MEPIEWSPAVIIPGQSVPLAFEAEREERAQQTGATAKRLVHEDLLSPVAVPAGDPGRISAVASADLDLLVCGSRGYGPVRSVILASVSRELARFGRLLLLEAPRPARQERTVLQRNRGASSPARRAN